MGLRYALKHPLTSHSSFPQKNQRLVDRPTFSHMCRQRQRRPFVSSKEAAKQKAQGQEKNLDTKTTRKTYKAIVSSTAKSGYRPDLRAPAVARASAIRFSQRPKKDTPEAKVRGAKAKKAAAAKDE